MLLRVFLERGRDTPHILAHARGIGLRDRRSEHGQRCECQGEELHCGLLCVLQFRRGRARQPRGDHGRKQHKDCACQEHAAQARRSGDEPKYRTGDPQRQIEKRRADVVVDGPAQILEFGLPLIQVRPGLHRTPAAAAAMRTRDLREIMGALLVIPASTLEFYAATRIMSTYLKRHKLSITNWREDSGRATIG